MAIPVILQGDSSGEVTISLAQGHNYEGATLVVVFNGVSRQYTNLTAGGSVVLAFTADETAGMPLGTALVNMRLVGANGGVETVGNADARIKVTDCVAEVNAGGSFAVTPGGNPLADVEGLGTRYTGDQLRAKINEVIAKLGGTVAALALALLPCLGGVTVQTAPLGGIYNDSPVVTNVQIDVSDKADKANTYTKTETDARIVELSPPTDLTPATNYTRAVLGAFAETGTVARAAIITDGTNTIDAAGNVYETRGVGDSWALISGTYFGSYPFWRTNEITGIVGWYDYGLGFGFQLLSTNYYAVEITGVVEGMIDDVYHKDTNTWRRVNTENILVGNLALTNDIPPAVTVVAPSTNATAGTAADAKATGTALYTGFTEWFCNEISSGWTLVKIEWLSNGDPNATTGAGWYVTVYDGYYETALYEGSDADAVSLSREEGGIFPGFSLSRHLVTPTKTSQLINDGTNGIPFSTMTDIPDVSGCATHQQATNAAIAVADAKISTNNEAFVSAVLAVPIAGADAGDLAEIAEYGGYGTVGAAVLALIAGLAALKRRVTSAETALAQKASLTDLPYALVTPGEWSFSGSGYDPSRTYRVRFSEVSDFTYAFIEIYDPVNDSWDIAASPLTDVSGTELSLSWDNGYITATRASLPGHLLDRAVNAVSVSAATELTIPAATAGKARDFLVRMVISGSTVPSITFADPTGETITYETDGDEFPVPDEVGTWLYAFTETDTSTFAVALKKVNTVAQGGGT